MAEIIPIRQSEFERSHQRSTQRMKADRLLSEMRCRVADLYGCQQAAGLERTQIEDLRMIAEMIHGLVEK